MYDYVMYVFLHVIQYTTTRTCTPQVHVAQDACICQFVTSKKGLKDFVAQSLKTGSDSKN